MNIKDFDEDKFRRGANIYKDIQVFINDDLKYFLDIMESDSKDELYNTFLAG